MKLSRNHIVLFLIVTAFVAFGQPAFGQKKKKEADEVQASNKNLREAEFYFTEGEKFFILEDYAKALSYYQRTLEIDPNNATVHYKIAEVLTQSNRSEDLQKAALSIDKSLKLEKKNKYFYILGANIYASLARFDRAAQIYETMLAEIKGTEEYLYELAAIYQYGNNIDQAVKAYQRAENFLGVNEVSSLQKQKIYLEQGKIKEAITEGEKLINAYPGEERYMMGFAEVLSQRGMKAEAIQHLEKYTEQNSDALSSKMLLAAFYRENREEEKARKILTALFDTPDVDINSKLIILGAYNAELTISKSNNRSDQDKFLFAEKLFQKLVDSESGDPNIHVIGGDLYLAGGNYPEARVQYLKAVQSGDVNFEVWQNLLFLENQLGLYDQLLEHSDQALEVFPNQGIIHYYNGCAFLKKKSYKQAISSFDQSKRLSATNASLMADINTKLGESYHGLEDYASSDKAFEDALSVTPDHYAALNSYSYLLAARKSKLDKAEKMAVQLVKDNPENATYLDTYSMVLFAQGKYKESRKIMERIISSGKSDAVHHEHYGDILYKLGELDAAVVQWEKARALNPKNELLNKKIANRKMYE